ncbi:MAG TPA: sigma-70 family RNA polymerase sigma factor, partial [Kofleriaceae bacterium]|nr:sigma-70 family RNA polymerase sigma factor [Kofleriaceae bacterium]
MKLALVSQDVMSDEELLERMASGDREALGLVFDRHHRALYAFLARAYPVEDADLDDLVQSTFLEAFRAAPRFRGASAPRTWLFALGRNLAKMHRRATSRRSRALQRFADLPARPMAALDAALADQRALAQIERALDELPHDLRVAYVMCVIEGVAAEDAARALAVARGTIWRRV